jgi:hypothetical protein
VDADEVDDVEAPELDAPAPAAVVLPSVDPVVLAALGVAEGGGAFTPPPDSASCAYNCAPPQAIATHTIPIAIRCFTRSRVSRKKKSAL